MTTTPNTKISYVPEGTLDPAAGLNLSLNQIDVLVQTKVISMSLTSPPASNSDGDMYVIASPATGDWAGHDDDVARYVSDGDFWQFYTASEVIKFVLNQDDGGFYKYLDISPGPGWILAAGLPDAPIDSLFYLRHNGSWVAAPDSLQAMDTDSPPLVINPVEVLVFGDGLRFSQLETGAGLVELGAVQVVNYSGANLDADDTNSGQYTRFSHADATYTFGDFGSPFPYRIGDEYHGRYTGLTLLEIVAATGFTINPPFGGSLFIPPGGTFTVKIVAEGEADLFGVTEPSS